MGKAKSRKFGPINEKPDCMSYSEHIIHVQMM